MAPAVFLSHGSPMIALEKSDYGDFLDGLPRTWPKVRSLVVFSAHWESAVQIVSAVEQYDTIHDFGGFPDELYALRYPAPGNGNLALKIHAVLEEAGMPSTVERMRGLDHGAWTLLKRLYPEADMPVVEMSVNARISPREQFRVGQALASLTDEDVLVLGSGVTVHNFQLLSHAYDVALKEKVHAFEEWLQARLVAWDLEALFDYRTQAPNADLAVPLQGTEHMAPLFYAMGACGSPETVRVLHESWMWDIMTNTAYQFD